MKSLHQQIKYIEYEIGKYETAYKINEKKLHEGDSSVILVMALIQDTLQYLNSIKVSLSTLKYTDNDGA
ncbi:hypothetical protein JMN32_05420 [Fulvivirga sp. 29W222]|uniref:Uncharacterized protein n=1 Tax=Fulvivirga marina TaxID=2494733 RepID=A0A937FVG9_9BACT|nr:hypothetical protein [Fulvivirga marina]MBL6445738.1 hypothetical protein [Fulvivirga marina]